MVKINFIFLVFNVNWLLYLIAILTRGFLTASVSFLEELRKVSTEFKATDLSAAQKKIALSASKF